MNSRFNKGFTLIELLVVIAIIGILSSIILVSLNSARNKGKDASAKGSLSSARAAAEIYYDTNGSYGAPGSGSGVCADPDVLSLFNAAKAQTLNSGNCNVGGGPGSTTSYAMDISLNQNAMFFCVDSTGFAGNASSTLGAATLCP